MKRRKKTFEEKRLKKKRAEIRTSLRQQMKDKQKPFIPKLKDTNLENFSKKVQRK